ncbi:MAG TPA: type II toxin-antitoxin system VapC family toxin [Candidatus Nanoarchaeia archaeon]|nr:type II toxin-antitoxin system VapC family toxin [Candidatus Nanoarchaeia archaeon]
MIIDTSALIALEKGSERLIEHIKKNYPDEKIALTSAIYAEFIFGFINRNKTIPSHLSLYDVIAFDRESAMIFAQLRKKIEKIGKPIPIFDLMTASCALRNNQTIVTYDRHFTQIKDLKVDFISSSS